MDSDTIFLWHGRLVQISCRCHRSHIRLSVSLMLVAGMRQLRNLRRKPNLHATGVQRGAESKRADRDRGQREAGYPYKELSSGFRPLSSR